MDYKEMTCAELQDLCKEKGLPRYKGKSKLNKQEMIDLLTAQTEVKNDEVVNQEELEKEVQCEQQKEQKEKYLGRIEVGMLVAFNAPEGRVRSAKVINLSAKNRKLKLVTEYAREYVVSYDDVLWVKTGGRWPKGVYDLLKGGSKNVG